MNDLLEKRLEFNPGLPISVLPSDVGDYFREMACSLLGELASSRPPVELVPAPVPMHEGHMVRTSNNPDWYRDIYWGQTYLSRRRKKPCRMRKRSHVDRRYVIDSLMSICDGTDSDRYHDVLLRDCIYSMLSEGYSSSLGKVPPNPIVIDFFS